MQPRSSPAEDHVRRRDDNGLPREVQRLHDLQALLMDIAIDFVGMGDEDFERSLELALQKLGQALGCDTGFICLYPAGGSQLILRYLWCDKRSAASAKKMRGLKARWFPRSIDSHREGRPVLVDSTLSGAEEAALDRRIITALGLKSLIATPLAIDGELIGCTGFANTQSTNCWSSDEIEVLNQLAHLIINVLSRTEALETLRENAQRFRNVAYYAAEIAFNADLEALEELAALRRQSRAEVIVHRQQESRNRVSQEMVGKSLALQRVFNHVSKVAPTDSTVLILGETGTGKELIARAVHRASLRAEQSFVKVDCGALPPTLIESELFGHEKGAFTGAIKRKIGLFELADQGTIFLDEIGELPHHLQVKLLRVLQEGEFVRIGSTEIKGVDVRVIAATNRPLEKAIETGAFRPDLYYRLSIFPVEIPPLRDRPEDIPILARHFLEKTSRKTGRPILRIPDDLMKAFMAHDWPGNVRELENLIECASVFSSGSTLTLPRPLLTKMVPKARREGKDSLMEVERDHIERILHECGWRIKGTGNAAERLQLPPSTLYARMQKLGVKRR